MFGIGCRLKFALGFDRQTFFLHEPGDAPAADDRTLLVQIVFDSPGAIGFSAFFEYPFDLGAKRVIGKAAVAGRSAQALIVAASGNLQNTTHGLDAEFSLLSHPGVLYRLFFAKYAAAFFRMSRSSLSWAISRRKRLSSS